MLSFDQTVERFDRDGRINCYPERQKLIYSRPVVVDNPLPRSGILGKSANPFDWPKSSIFARYIYEKKPDLLVDAYPSGIFVRSGSVSDSTSLDTDASAHSHNKSARFAPASRCDNSAIAIGNTAAARAADSASPTFGAARDRALNRPSAVTGEDYCAAADCHAPSFDGESTRAQNGGAAFVKGAGRADGNHYSGDRFRHAGGA